MSGSERERGVRFSGWWAIPWSPLENYGPDDLPKIHETWLSEPAPASPKSAVELDEAHDSVGDDQHPSP